jgi:hypothetical protein
MKHDSQSKDHSIKQKGTKKQQPRSENCVTTTYLFHVIHCLAEFLCLCLTFLQFSFEALLFCYKLLLFFQSPLKTEPYASAWFKPAAGC